jgi:hypothetical protein
MKLQEEFYLAKTFSRMFTFYTKIDLWKLVIFGEISRRVVCGFPMAGQGRMAQVGRARTTEFCA